MRWRNVLRFRSYMQTTGDYVVRVAGFGPLLWLYRFEWTWRPSFAKCLPAIRKSNKCIGWLPTKVVKCEYRDGPRKWYEISGVK